MGLLDTYYEDLIDSVQEKGEDFDRNSELVFLCKETRHSMCEKGCDMEEIEETLLEEIRNFIQEERRSR